VALQLSGRLNGPPSGTLRDLVETNPSARDAAGAAINLASNPALDIVVILDSHRRPVGVADLESVAMGMTSEPMRLNLDTPTREAGRRAMGRPRHTRFQPVICTDNAGRYAGVVHLERLIGLLSREHPPT
jgi:hypothetical protein